LTNDQTLVNALSTNWHIAQLTPADHAMLSYCETLTSTPSEMGEQDIAHLRDAGFSDNAILDISHVAGYYAYANRIADGLGVQLESEL